MFTIKQHTVMKKVLLGLLLIASIASVSAYECSDDKKCDKKSSKCCKSKDKNACKEKCDKEKCESEKGSRRKRHKCCSKDSTQKKGHCDKKANKDSVSEHKH